MWSKGIHIFHASDTYYGIVFWKYEFIPQGEMFERVQKRRLGNWEALERRILRDLCLNQWQSQQSELRARFHLKEEVKEHSVCEKSSLNS